MTEQGNRTVDDRHDLAPLGSAPLAGAEVPTRVRVAPWGEVESSRGRFVVDEESAAAVVRAFEAHGTDLPIDYEHQTLGGAFTAPNGQAPAAGWIRRLDAEPGVGIFAHVAWTEPALAQLAARQYRYLSPVAVVRRSDRKLVEIHSAALTNKPAIVGMEPIVNRSEPDGDTIGALRERLALGAECDVAELLAAANSRLSAWERERAREAAERRVETLLRGGRATEAQREFAVRLALAAPDLFEAWAATAPVVVPLGRTTPPETATGRSDRAVAAQARAEFRAHPELAALTSEEAYAADALRSRERVL